MAQEKLNITVSFEGELAQYLKDIAEIDNKTVEEMLVHLAMEALEEDIEFSKMIERQDADGEELIRAEDWDNILSEETTGNKNTPIQRTLSKKTMPATIRSKIIKKIEEKLTTDPLKAGMPFRGK